MHLTKTLHPRTIARFNKKTPVEALRENIFVSIDDVKTQAE